MSWQWIFNWKRVSKLQRAVDTSSWIALLRFTKLPRLMFVPEIGETHNWMEDKVVIEKDVVKYNHWEESSDRKGRCVLLIAYIKCGTENIRAEPTPRDQEIETFYWWILAWRKEINTKRFRNKLSSIIDAVWYQIWIIALRDLDCFSELWG